jgi:hypothetical protein
LLRVDLRATTLVGRDGEMASLRAWLADTRPVLVRCMTGRAGAGKTRLGVELCEWAEREGWTAGFAQYGQLPEFLKHAASWWWHKPTLVVIDYAASLARSLRTCLEALVQREPPRDEKPLRILLLERHAERNLGWWAELMRSVSLSAPGPDEFADPPEPVALGPLAEVEDRRALLAEAMRLAGEIARVQPRREAALAAAEEATALYRELAAQRPHVFRPDFATALCHALLAGSDGPFCFGEGPTLADLCLVPQLYNARRFGVELDGFPRLLAAEAACQALPAFAQAAPERQPDTE